MWCTSEVIASALWQLVRFNLAIAFSVPFSSLSEPIGTSVKVCGPSCF